LADYFTKHHPACHHKSMHPAFLTTGSNHKYRKLFVMASTTQKPVPSITTLVATKSFVKTLLLIPKFRGMPQNTVTARNA
jgi:hypothetical protein